MERRRVEHPDRPLIRISSTFFYHLSPQEEIEPLPQLAERRREILGVIDRESAAKLAVTYPRMYVGELVQR